MFCIFLSSGRNDLEKHKSTNNTKRQKIHQIHRKYTDFCAVDFPPKLFHFLDDVVKKLF